MKTCPFKIKLHRAKLNEKNEVYDFNELEEYDACRIMNSSYDECVGEDKCPITSK